MAITDKEKGVWGLDQVFNKINQGSIWEYNAPGGDSVLWFNWGNGARGLLGQNNQVSYSSPIQIPGNWAAGNGPYHMNATVAAKHDGTMWAWGSNSYGTLGLNAGGTDHKSSPTQIPGTTWKQATIGYRYALATKTDGTLWSWGYGDRGGLAQNNRASCSSPIQIPGTTWNRAFGQGSTASAYKTDGTLWMWGFGNNGQLGNNKSHPSSSQEMRSSPIQLPGTTWDVNAVSQGGGDSVSGSIKTDGTLWTWGWNQSGDLGHNSVIWRSSPTQIPGTNWAQLSISTGGGLASKTDGTLWTWGNNNEGQLGLNSRTQYSSPTQIPGTTWSTDTGALTIGRAGAASGAVKTDGTLWMWGSNSYGNLGHNSVARFSSPTQVPGSWTRITSSNYTGIGLK